MSDKFTSFKEVTLKVKHGNVSTCISGELGKHCAQFACDSRPVSHFHLKISFCTENKQLISKLGTNNIRHTPLLEFNPAMLFPRKLTWTKLTVSFAAHSSTCINSVCCTILAVTEFITGSLQVFIAMKSINWLNTITRNWKGHLLFICNPTIIVVRSAFISFDLKKNFYKRSCKYIIT